MRRAPLILTQKKSGGLIPDLLIEVIMRRFENKKYYFHGYIMKPEPLIYLKQVWKKCVNSRDRQRETFFALFSKSITGKSDVFANFTRKYSHFSVSTTL